MQRNIIIAIIFILVLGIAGCGGGGAEDTTASKWRQGNRGLEMSFQQGSPPTSVHSGDKIDVVINLWNRGAEPLSGELYLAGFDPSIFQGIPTTPAPISIIDAKSRYNTEGGYSIARATGRVVLPEGVDAFTTKFNAVGCYTYETFAAIPICIDPEPNKNDATDPCTPGAYSSGTQAAPVAVSNVQVESTTSRAILRITVRNVGPGEILDESIIGRCMDFDILPADKNWIDLVEAKLGNAYALQCEPTNPIKVPDGTGTITCWVDNPGTTGGAAFMTTLNLRLRYGYKETISTSVEARSAI